MRRLTEIANTWQAVLGALAMFAGMVAWMTSLHAQVMSTVDEVVELKQDLRAFDVDTSQQLRAVGEDLRVVQTDVKWIRESLEDDKWRKNGRAGKPKAP